MLIGPGFMAMLKLSLVTNAEAFDSQEAEGAGEHEQAAHSQGLAVVEGTRLAQEAENGGGKCGGLRTSDENSSPKFAHADGEGEDSPNE